MIRALRGAICAENSADGIHASAAILLMEIFAANKIKHEDVVAVTFTCTKDLDAAHPAAAARNLGLAHASLLCVQEMDVVGALPRCIRVQLLVNTEIAQNELKHIYIGAAKILRPDIK